MSPEQEPSEERPGFDPEALYEEIERAVLGSARRLNRVEVAEAADVPLERAVELWRALGFPGTSSDDEVLFVERDVEALRLVTWLVESGFLEREFELTLTRSLGRSFARLAEWEVTELASAAMSRSMLTDSGRLEEMLSRLLPVVEDVQNYVWRRHVASAAGRILLHPGSEGGTRMAVGFADIVGFTRRSRGMSHSQLSELIEVFEATAARVVTEHRGRTIKTIGDEVLFVADDVLDAARIALALVEASADEVAFPEVRVGLAYGEVVSRLGDVFGPVVNIASRLTSLARPGRILVDREMHERLGPHADEVRVKRSRTTSVRGYSRLDTWTLKRPRQRDDTNDGKQGKRSGRHRKDSEDG
ncbi:adenylate/guanylate cyclase domain-containing protein [Nocardioides caldifontis]|uniref:adenylate/guanylate cyclase domain-containing protein n=1 Tax=Nocardioides caldifontis TaxID=2588938 RepID=UPI0011DF21A3|nr:adenylate/guanylate cyclase domain-containing protein [Nocardioides caldifontis]